jgi:hypothetical protein
MNLEIFLVLTMSSRLATSFAMTSFALCYRWVADSNLICSSELKHGGHGKQHGSDMAKM